MDILTISLCVVVGLVIYVLGFVSGHMHHRHLSPNYHDLIHKGIKECCKHQN